MAALLPGHAHGHVHLAVAQAPGVDLLALVGQVDVHAPGHVLVVPRRDLGQCIAPRLELIHEPRAVDGVPLGRHLPDGVLDRGVRELALEILRRAHEVFPAEADQEAPILLGAVVGQPADVRVLRAELLEAGIPPPPRVQRHALIARERLVAVLGDRDPERVARHLRPAPLLPVPVPVAHEDVHEPRLEEGLRVGHVAFSRFQLLVERGVIDDLGGAREAGDGALRRLRVDAEDADGAGEVLAELAEGGIVGKDDEPPLRDGDPHRLEDPAGDHLARRMLGRHLVVQELRDDGVLQRGVDHIEQVRRVLLQSAEGVAAPVRAGEGEPFRLLAADTARRREAARLPAEVEHLDADRRSPGRAVLVAEPEAVKAVRMVVARDYRLAARGIGGGCRERSEEQEKGGRGRAEARSRRPNGRVLH